MGTRVEVDLVADVLEPRLAPAISDGGVLEPDGRGLMPLAEARALLAGTSEFARGEGAMVGEVFVYESDRLWAALLSLEDAREFVSVASRLTWAFHPRGFDNVDLVLRYGDGVVPWLETLIDADGKVAQAPWCVVPCLLACGSPEAFALAWRVPDDPSARRPILRTWCDRHPETAAIELARRAAEPRARAHLVGMRLRQGLGQAASGAATSAPSVASAPGSSTTSPGEAALALLDACALGLSSGARLTWPPALGGAQPMRAIAARDGDRWGVALQRVDGDRPSGLRAARAQTFLYGPGVAGEAAQRSGPLLTDGAPTDPQAFSAWLRARPLGGLLGPPEALLADLGLPPSARVVTVADEVPSPMVTASGAVPSDMPVFRALAAALDGAELDRAEVSGP
jgi:hypothetical protein